MRFEVVSRGFGEGIVQFADGSTVRVPMRFVHKWEAPEPDVQTTAVTEVQTTAVTPPRRARAKRADG